MFGKSGLENRHKGKVLVLAESLKSASTRRYIRAVAKHADQVVCYIKHSDMPPGVFKAESNIKVIQLKDLALQSPESPKSMYLIAQQMIHQMVSVVKEAFPGFFQDEQTCYDYENLFRFPNQYDTARIHLNFVPLCLKVLETVEYDSAIFLNCTLVYDETRKLLSQLYPGMDNPKIFIRHSENLPKNRYFFTLQFFGKQVKYAFKQLLRRKPTLESQLVISFAQAPWHLSLVYPVLRCLQPRYQIALLNYFGKNRAYEEADFEPHVSANSGLSHYTILDQKNYFPLNGTLARQRRFFEARVGGLSQSKASYSVQVMAFRQLKTLEVILRQFAKLESLIHHTRPQLVVACMEKDTRSLMLKEIRKKYPLSTLNIQHGAIPPTGTLNLFSFDRFLVWNDLTRSVVIQDGYRDQEGIRIVNNPVWEKMHRDYREATTQPSEALRALQAWKYEKVDGVPSQNEAAGTNKLIVAYSQPAMDYMTDKAREEFIAAHLYYLQQRDNVKLLIKKHPSEKDRLPEELVERFNLSHRVKVYSAREISLLESLFVADLATSICSTVLLESLYFGVQSAAVDFQKLMRKLCYGYETLIPMIHEKEEVISVFDQLLESPEIQLQEPYKTLTPETKEKLFPQFENVYEERIRQILKEAHWM